MTEIDSSVLNNAISNLAANIDSKLSVVNKNVLYVNERMSGIESVVDVTRSELQDLIRQFLDYVKVSESRYNLTLAETRIIKICQELDKKFGYYDEIRRMATGILQATDDSLVRRKTITSVTEESILKAPGYWLAPALLALTAWINDDRELAERALKKALSIDDERTSLLFALICRRANRPETSIRWLQKYISSQDPDNLSRNMVVILDSFVSGILGVDSEGIVHDKLDEWLIHITDETDFGQNQHDLWLKFMEAHKGVVNEGDWKYLKTYSPTWPEIKETLSYLQLHSNVYDYLVDILDAPVETGNLLESLDKILDDLVTRYDNEELELRQKKRMNELIIEYDGDLDKATAVMDSEKNAYDESTDYATLLNTVITSPEASNCSKSLQKYAVAKCKDWIAEAYRSAVVKNRAEIPSEIKIAIDSFSAVTEDGSNEREIINDIETHVEKECLTALKAHNLSAGTHFCLVGGIALIGLGAITISGGILGIVLLIAGAGLTISWISKWRKSRSLKKATREQYEKKKASLKGIARATIAEAVDFRCLVEDLDSTDKLDTLFDTMDPKQMMVNLNNEVRKIRPISKG